MGDVFTIRDFIAECESFPYSREYFEMCELQADIELKELYIESIDYQSHNDVSYMESGYFVEYDSIIYTEAKASVAKNKQGLFRRMMNGLANGFHRFVGSMVRIVRKLQGYETSTDILKMLKDNPHIQKSMVDSWLEKYSSQHIAKIATMKIMPSKKFPKLTFDSDVTEERQKAFTNEMIVLCDKKAKVFFRGKVRKLRPVQRKLEKEYRRDKAKADKAVFDAQWETSPEANRTTARVAGTISAVSFGIAIARIASDLKKRKFTRDWKTQRTNDYNNAQETLNRSKEQAEKLTSQGSSNKDAESDFLNSLRNDLVEIRTSIMEGRLFTTNDEEALNKLLAALGEIKKFGEINHPPSEQTVTGTDANGNPVTSTNYVSNPELLEVTKLTNEVLGLLVDAESEQAQVVMNARRKEELAKSLLGRIKNAGQVIASKVKKKTDEGAGGEVE